MQAAMEPLFQAYGVNLVLSGHIHTYERSYPVFQFNPTRGFKRMTRVKLGSPGPLRAWIPG